MSYLRKKVILPAVVVGSFLFCEIPLMAQETPTVSNAVTSTVVPAAAGNVSLDFKEADITNVLRILSLKSKVNIVAGPEVQGTVTIRLEDVPWDKALDVVLRTYGYVYERQGNIIRVTTKENLATEELITETFILNYTTADEAREAIADILSERGRIKSVARTNMLVVTDIPTNLFKIREVIRKLDHATPQAFIDAKIVRTQKQVGENLGIQWATAATLSGAERPVTFPFAAVNKRDDAPDAFARLFNNFFPSLAVPTTGSATSAGASDETSNPFTSTGFQVLDSTRDPIFQGGAASPYSLGTLDFTAFSAILQFLKQRSDTRVVSNPRITVLNNQKAKINVGREIPLPTLERNETSGSFEITGFTYRETGVVMEVTPHINDANEILVDLAPQVSSSTSSTSFGGTGSFTTIPNFDVQSATTQVLIRSGETIAIGGLLTDSVDIDETKIPVLGDIPILGKAFRSKRQTQDANNTKDETLFFVTVTVVDTQGQPVVTPA